MTDPSDGAPLGKACRAAEVPQETVRQWLKNKSIKVSPRSRGRGIPRELLLGDFLQIALRGHLMAAGLSDRTAKETIPAALEYVNPILGGDLAGPVYFVLVSRGRTRQKTERHVAIGAELGTLLGAITTDWPIVTTIINLTECF